MPRSKWKLALLAVAVLCLPGTPTGLPAAEPPTGAYLGVDVQNVTPDRVGVLKLSRAQGVEVVAADAAAAAGRAGIKQGDVLLKFNDVDITDREHLRTMLSAAAPGQLVTFLLSREGELWKFEIRLGARPPGSTPTAGGSGGKVVAERPLPSPPPRAGTLKVITHPEIAQVYLDNRPKGVTSEAEGELILEDLAPGPYRVRVSLEGYSDWKQEVQVEVGKTLIIEAKLEPRGPKPLSLAEVEEALQGGLTSTRIAALVKQYGVDFALTADNEQRLRAAGANDSVLLAVAKNKK